MSAAAQVNPESQIAPSAAKVPMMRLVLLTLLLLAAVGGGLYWWHSRHASAQGKSSAVVAPPLTHDLAMEPLLVNLADDSGHAYLRVAMVLQVDDDLPTKKMEKEKKNPAIPSDARQRDAALDVLGRQVSTALLASDGKEQLKKELLNAMATRAPEPKVRAIYFTEFLVQR